MKGSRAFVLLTGLGLAACGRVTDLKPVPGHNLPIKPEMARAQPTAKDLLTPPTYARPDRVDELVKRSQPRPADPFDLPPPTGGAAPSQPAGTVPQQPATDTSVKTPGE